MFLIAHCLFMLSDLDGLLVDLFQIFIDLFIPVTDQNVWPMSKNPSLLSWKSFWLPLTPLKSITLLYLTTAFPLKEDESMSVLLKELRASSKHHFILSLLKVSSRNVLP